MKPNPFEKYLSKEDKLQESVMKYIALQYPHAFAVHIPNEGRRTRFEQYKIKTLGVVSGMPDVMIFNPNAIFSGLAIELKVGYNKPTENQKKFLRRLENGGWDCHWVNTFDKAKEIIDKYFESEL